MCGREMLTKLTAGAVKLDGGGGGGIPALAGCEAAGMLAGLSDEATAMALYRYAGNQGLEHVLFYAAYRRIVDLAGRDKWSIPVGEEMLRKLTKCALFELLGTGICPRCHGTGQVIADVDGVRKCCTCPSCQGIGRRRLLDGQVAAVIHRSERQYRETWKPRYQLITRDLGLWSSDLECDLDKVLRVSMKNSC